MHLGSQRGLAYVAVGSCCLLGLGSCAISTAELAGPLGGVALAVAIAWAIGLGVTAAAHRGWLALRDRLVRTRGWSLATLRPPVGRTYLLSSAGGGWLLGFLFDRASNVESLGGLGQAVGFWAGLAFGASAVRLLPSLTGRLGNADEESSRPAA